MTTTLKPGTCDNPTAQGYTCTFRVKVAGSTNLCATIVTTAFLSAFFYSRFGQADDAAAVVIHSSPRWRNANPCQKQRGVDRPRHRPTDERQGLRSTNAT